MSPPQINTPVGPPPIAVNAPPPPGEMSFHGPAEAGAAGAAPTHESSAHTNVRRAQSNTRWSIEPGGTRLASVYRMVMWNDSIRRVAPVNSKSINWEKPHSG